MKKLNCRDLGFECDQVVKAESEEEILTQAAAHAQQVHGVKEVTPELVQAVKTNIQEE